MIIDKLIGRPVKRKEDIRLITGKGNFVDDLKIPGMCYAAILRSPYAHARITRIDVSDAERSRGVVAVLTGDEVAAMSAPLGPTSYYCMALEKVRYVGEPVAAVVAEDRYAAIDALDLINVEYEVLPAVSDAKRAMEDGAPKLHESLGSNVIWHKELSYGDLEGAFRSADLVIGDEFRFHRYSSTPIETYGVIADFNPAEGVLTIWSNCQGLYTGNMVSELLRTPEVRDVRYIIPEVGGAFGIKAMSYPYMLLVSLLAIKSRRAVKWTESRREHLMASSHHAERVARAEIAARRDGKILGVRMRVIEDVGAYMRPPEPGGIIKIIGCFTGPYKIPAFSVDAYYVATNKCPTGPNRGYGILQHAFILERLVDMLSKELSMDPVKLRVKNFIRSDDFPYRSPGGGVYDGGDYEATLMRALEASEYEEWVSRREEFKRRGKLLGIGVACLVEPAVTNWSLRRVIQPGAPISGNSEAASVRMDREGKVHVMVGSTPQGQGHETVISQIVAETLGVDIEDVIVESVFDSSRNPWVSTSGTYASRFSSVSTGAVYEASKRLREKLLSVAASCMEANPLDLEIAEGKVFVRGEQGRSLPIKELARIASSDPHRFPAGIDLLQASAVYSFPYPENAVPDEEMRLDSVGTYASSANVAIVAIDEETGAVEILKLVTCIDSGRLLNPMIAEGQVHGAVAHGIGGSLLEEVKYDEEGQLLTLGFMDYAAPTALEIPEIRVTHIETHSQFSPLGAKGIGEGGAVAMPPTIASAIEDALAARSIKIRELPLTPERVWRLIKCKYNE